MDSCSLLPNLPMPHRYKRQSWVYILAEAMAQSVHSKVLVKSAAQIKPSFWALERLLFGAACALGPLPLSDSC